MATITFRLRSWNEIQVVGKTILTGRKIRWSLGRNSKNPCRDWKNLKGLGKFKRPGRCKGRMGARLAGSDRSRTTAILIAVQIAVHKDLRIGRGEDVSSPFEIYFSIGICLGGRRLDMSLAPTWAV